MAFFHQVPGDQTISRALITAGRRVFTVGLRDYLESPGHELTVRSDTQAVRPVSTTRVHNNSRQWEIHGADGESALITAENSAGQVVDAFMIVFRIGRAPAADITVRSIIQDVFGSDSANHLLPVSIPQYNIIDLASFRAGQRTNAPRFTMAAARGARLGVFAARKGQSQRAVILLVPQSASPSRILLGITHGFGQNQQYYSAKGWRNPLSPDLIKDVATRFVVERWGPQMLATRKEMAMVMPVRAAGGSELGPFADDGAFLKQALDSMSLLTGGAFTADHAEAFTFSSGIYDLNRLLSAAKNHISFEAIYSCDPASATQVLHQGAGTVVKQFLSGQTGGPRPGFEFMPLPRWVNEPKYPDRARIGNFNYLHNWVMPRYVLNLGIQTS